MSPTKMMSKSYLLVFLSFIPALHFTRAQNVQPMYGQPAYGLPAYGQPAYGQPNYGQYPGNPYPADQTTTAGAVDAVTEYQRRYGALPPAYPPPKPFEAGTTTTAMPSAEVATTETPELKAAEAEAAAEMNPSMISDLKKVIASQQNELSKLQNDVSSLLKELKEEEGRVQREKAAAAAPVGRNALSLSIEFPQTTPKGGKKPKQIGVKKTVPAEGATKAIESEEPLVTKPIPVMVVKPDPVQEIQHLAEQVIEQEMTENAIHEGDATLPPEMQLKSPEERAADAIAEIDKLEAEKAKLETESRILKKQLQAPGMSMGGALMGGLLSGLTGGAPMGTQMGNPYRY